MMYLSSIQPLAIQTSPLLPPYRHHSYDLSFSTSSPQYLRIPRCRRHFRISAIDASQPYDDDQAHLFNRSSKLKIGIVGFGNFGQFLAKAFIRQGHTVLAHSRSNYHATAQSLGAIFFSNPHDFCEQHPVVVLICSSIIDG